MTRISSCIRKTKHKLHNACTTHEDKFTLEVAEGVSGEFAVASTVAPRFALVIQNIGYLARLGSFSRWYLIILLSCLSEQMHPLALALDFGFAELLAPGLAEKTLYSPFVKLNDFLRG